jgi:hypothetical protein
MDEGKTEDDRRRTRREVVEGKASKESIGTGMWGRERKGWIQNQGRGGGGIGDDMGDNSGPQRWEVNV